MQLWERNLAKHIYMKQEQQLMNFLKWLAYAAFLAFAVVPIGILMGAILYFWIAGTPII